jgi:hypothetical protein
VVINCDFEKYMWTSDAAGCLAGTLYDFITSRGIDDLVVITHSNGGNVMRWILSNPTWDSRYPTIIQNTRWVNALAPSSTGTPLADAVMQGNVFEQSLGWLLGYKSDAVRMQQVGWMAYYNSAWLYGTSGPPVAAGGLLERGRNRRRDRYLGRRQLLRRLHPEPRSGDHPGVAGQLLRRLPGLLVAGRRRQRVVLRHPVHQRRRTVVPQPEPSAVLRPRHILRNDL